MEAVIFTGVQGSGKTTTVTHGEGGAFVVAGRP
jgi:hypothetical protein